MRDTDYRDLSDLYHSANHSWTPVNHDDLRRLLDNSDAWARLRAGLADAATAGISATVGKTGVVLERPGVSIRRITFEDLEVPGKACFADTLASMQRAG